jgi:hypothetical protein
MVGSFVTDCFPDGIGSFARRELPPDRLLIRLRSARNIAAAGVCPKVSGSP